MAFVEVACVMSRGYKSMIFLFCEWFLVVINASKVSVFMRFHLGVLVNFTRLNTRSVSAVVLVSVYLCLIQLVESIEGVLSNLEI